MGSSGYWKARCTWKSICTLIRDALVRFRYLPFEVSKTSKRPEEMRCAKSHPDASCRLIVNLQLDPDCEVFTASCGERIGAAFITVPKIARIVTQTPAVVPTKQTSRQRLRHGSQVSDLCGSKWGRCFFFLFFDFYFFHFPSRPRAWIRGEQRVPLTYYTVCALERCFGAFAAEAFKPPFIL